MERWAEEVEIIWERARKRRNNNHLTRGEVTYLHLLETIRNEKQPAVVGTFLSPLLLFLALFLFLPTPSREE